MTASAIRLAMVLTLVAWPLAAGRAHAETDLVLAIDLSGTMATNDPHNYRFLGASQLLTFLTAYGRNRAAIVSFGNDAKVVLPLDYVSFDLADSHGRKLEGVNAEAWTELGYGLTRADELLAGSKARRRAVILLSDGHVEGNPGVRRLNKDEAARIAEQELWNTVLPRLKAARIKVYTIGLLEHSQRGEPTLVRIARDTGGFYERVRRPEDLPRVYKRILDDIDHPAAVIKIDRDQQSLPLGPTDESLIVYCHGPCSVQGPDGTEYGLNKQSPPSSPMKQRWFSYPNGDRIGVLIARDGVAGKDRAGSFRVENAGESAEGMIRGAGRLRVHSPSHEHYRRDRDGYFRDEILVVHIELAEGGGAILEATLAETKGEYTILPEDGAAPIPGDLQRHGREFRGKLRAPLAAGNYRFDARLRHRNEVYRTQTAWFTVVDRPLIMLTVKEPLTAGDNMSPEVHEVVKASGTVKGLQNGRVDLMVTFEKTSDGEKKFDTAGRGNVFRPRRAITLHECGPVTVRARYSGKLVVEHRGADGQPGSHLRDVEAEAQETRAVTCPSCWKDLWCILEKLVWGVVTALGIVGGVVTLVAFVRQKQWKRLHTAWIEDGRGFTQQLAEAPDSRSARLRQYRTPAVAVLHELPHQDPDAAFEIGVGLGGRYHLRNRGTRPIQVGSADVQPGDSQPVTEGDQITVPGMRRPLTFRTGVAEAAVH